MEIAFRKHSRRVHASAGQSLMDALLESGIAVASSCRGDGVCGKCRLRVVSGDNLLTSPNDVEVALASRLKLDPDERISCQAILIGAPPVPTPDGILTVDADYW